MEAHAFVVRSASLDFLRPARLADQLTVDLVISRLRRSSLTFTQQVLRDTECLCRADVGVVAVNVNTFRPCALPPAVLRLLDPWLPAECAA